MKQINRNDIEMKMEVVRSVVSGQEGATSRVWVVLGCNHDAPRPNGWRDMAALLESLGFELEKDFDGSDEIFAPTSFFSARAEYVAGKSYARSAVRTMASDIARIHAALEGFNAGSLKGVGSHHEWLTLYGELASAI